MFDIINAIRGNGHCPWCYDQPEDKWIDRLYNRLPTWLVILEMRYNKLWRIGQMWHNKFHKAA